jgi:RNA polymerase sigma-70 factor (ECF subfamily)
MYESYTDEQLVAVYLKSKDEQALETLVQRYLSQIYNFVFKYVHTVSDAEDVTQESFVKIWHNLDKFDPHKKFKTWTFTIAKNTALDLLKRKGLVPLAAMPEEAETSLMQSLISHEPLPEAALEKIEDFQTISHAVKQLPDKYQKILSLYYDKELNFREISELLKESLNTVKTWHRRAVIRLKKIILQK